MNALYPKKRWHFLLLGALLSLGAPLGWLGLQWLMKGLPPAEQIAADPVLIAYLVVPTMAVFTTAGYFLGRQWELLQQANHRLHQLASYDGLTGLPNTRRFWEDLRRHCQRSKRHGQALNLLAIDIDHFKQVNDTLGHLAGDQVLRGVAQEIDANLRVEEGAYRVGGEEFAVILDDTTLDEAKNVAERLRRAVAARQIWPHEGGKEDLELQVTISIGIAGCDEKFCPAPQRLYELADQALYDAKQGGRNRVALIPTPVLLHCA